MPELLAEQLPSLISSHPIQFNMMLADMIQSTHVYSSGKAVCSLAKSYRMVSVIRGNRTNTLSSVRTLSFSIIASLFSVTMVGEVARSLFAIGSSIQQAKCAN